jgi:hypothetical protein
MLIQNNEVNRANVYDMYDNIQQRKYLCKEVISKAPMTEQGQSQVPSNEYCRDIQKNKLNKIIEKIRYSVNSNCNIEQKNNGLQNVSKKLYGHSTKYRNIKTKKSYIKNIPYERNFEGA